MANLSFIEIIYWASAIIGGTLFIFRAVLFFIAGDVSDVEGTDGFFEAGDVDISDGSTEIHHGDTDLSFKLLSLQSLTAFFMMFGIFGLAFVAAGWDVIWTVFGGAAIGVFAMWVLGLIFNTMIRLQSEGTIDIENAIGETGTVYLTVPANGSGQVQVSVQGSLKVYDAISGNKKKLATGEKIKVVGVVTGNTLIVEKLI
ncbi:MAG: hypothetical protein DWQ07_04675 [Chloroflexi bacterium]|nr:MAG: hypothetical protein DWQ07_04675 [Chloroflexota bacterium]MBL1194725.1 hypothetical protein [Chloroflexota bacterium]NOH12018.1 NfeD family protein [Chloroflexota bacterium]